MCELWVWVGGVLWGGGVVWVCGVCSGVVWSCWGEGVRACRVGLVCLGFWSGWIRDWALVLHRGGVVGWGLGCLWVSLTWGSASGVLRVLWVCGMYWLLFSGPSLVCSCGVNCFCMGVLFSRVGGGCGCLGGVVGVWVVGCGVLSASLVVSFSRDCALFFGWSFWELWVWLRCACVFVWCCLLRWFSGAVVVGLSGLPPCGVIGSCSFCGRRGSEVDRHAFYRRGSVLMMAFAGDAGVCYR